MGKLYCPVNLTMSKPAALINQHLKNITNQWSRHTLSSVSGEAAGSPGVERLFPMLPLYETEHEDYLTLEEDQYNCTIVAICGKHRDETTLFLVLE